MYYLSGKYYKPVTVQYCTTDCVNCIPWLTLLEKAMAPHSSTLAWKIPWMEEPGRLQSMGSLESDMTEWLHFHFSLSCIGEGMATHSSVLAWRIPGMGKPGGLLSMGLHRVGHDWSDLAAAAVAAGLMNMPSEWNLFICKGFTIIQIIWMLLLPSFNLN